MRLSFKKIVKDQRITEFIEQSAKVLKFEGYTEHGFRHCELAATRARYIARKVGLSARDQELAAVAGYCHDIGNFLGRTQHHYWSALLFSQLYLDKYDYAEVAEVMQAIANHDKEEMKLSSAISAAVVLADKADVHRDRVVVQDMQEVRKDIHDRVNYATTESKLTVSPKKKEIKLSLKIDTEFVPIMEYFEIFTDRMSYCRKAAEFLGCKFALEINKVKLL